MLEMLMTHSQGRLTCLGADFSACLPGTIQHPILGDCHLEEEMTPAEV